MRKAITLTLAAFARDLGAHHRLTLEVSLVWHKQYVKADNVTQAALKEEFILNFLQGMGYTATKAAKLLAMTRSERNAEDEKAVNAASHKFGYHIVRREKSPEGNGKTDAVQALADKFAKLTKREQTRFLKLVSQ